MLERYVEEEFESLCAKYSGKNLLKKSVLHFEDKRFFSNFKETVTQNRRGEVGFLLKRKNGRFVLVRNKKYPSDVLRIPTGGIEFNESAEDALYREVKEELGVSFEVESFEGLIEYEIHHEDDVVKFYSFLFVINEKSGEILTDATDDEIYRIREFEKKELSEVENSLRNSNGSWKDWGAFRAELLKFYNEQNVILEG